MPIRFSGMLADETMFQGLTRPRPVRHGRVVLVAGRQILKQRQPDPQLRSNGARKPHRARNAGLRRESRCSPMASTVNASTRWDKHPPHLMEHGTRSARQTMASAAITRSALASGLPREPHLSAIFESLIKSGQCATFRSARRQIDTDKMIDLLEGGCRQPVPQPRSRRREKKAGSRTHPHRQNRLEQQRGPR